MQIAQILNEGEGAVLNNVTIDEVYEYKNFAGGKSARSLLIHDDSAKTLLKIWGVTGSQQFSKGEVISVEAQGSRGGLTANEFPAGSGKFSINANNVEIIREGGYDASAASTGASAAPAGASASAGRVSQPAQSSGKVLNPDELANSQVAHFARIMKNLGPLAETMQISPDAAAQAAATMTGSASDWWFGAKYPGHVE